MTSLQTEQIDNILNKFKKMKISPPIKHDCFHYFMERLYLVNNLHGWLHYNTSDVYVEMKKITGYVLSKDSFYKIIYTFCCCESPAAFDFIEFLLCNGIINPCTIKNQNNILTDMHFETIGRGIKNNGKTFEDLLILIIEYGCDVKFCTPLGCSPLFNALKKNYQRLFEVLLERGADLDIVYENKNILEYCVEQGRYWGIDRLLELKTFSFNIFSCRDWYNMSREGFFKPYNLCKLICLNIILKHGIFFDIKYFYEVTPKMIKYIIKKGLMELYKYFISNYKKDNNYMQTIIRVVRDQPLDAQIAMFNSTICEEITRSYSEKLNSHYPMDLEMYYVEYYIYDKFIYNNSFYKKSLSWCNFIGEFNSGIINRRKYEKDLDKYFVKKDSIRFINRTLRGKQCYNFYNIDLNGRVVKRIGSITIMCFILLNFKTINIPLFDSLIAKGGDINEPIIYPNGIRISLLDQLKTRVTNQGMIAYVQSKL